MTSTILIKRLFRRLSPRFAVFSSSAAQLIGFNPDSYWFFLFTQNYSGVSFGLEWDAIAGSEMREYEFSTVKSRRNDIKKAMQAMVDAEIPLLKDTMQVLFEYFYGQLLSFQREESIELAKTYKKGVKGKNREKTPIKIAQLVDDCHKTLEQLMTGQNPHWSKVSVAVGLGTGRRMAEIHALGQFEVRGEYELYFSGQAKTRGVEDAKTDYAIPTLFPAATLKRAIAYLDEQDKRLDPEEQKRDRNSGAIGG